MNTQIELGTVIEGTLRPQDLIPAFMDALCEYAPAEYDQVTFGAFPAIPSYVFDEGDESEWWDSDDCAYLLESLFDALNEAAPDGCYFGAHPGDGADFGFWEAED